MRDKKRYERIKEELKKTNATAWKKLIEKAGTHGTREARNLEILVSLVRKYYLDSGSKEVKYIELKSNNPKEEELKEYHKYVAISEDGSIAPGGIISMAYYVVISSAIVIFPGYYQTAVENPIIEIDADLESYPVDEDISLIKKKANLSMMKRETGAINKALNKFLSLKDNRIIDKGTPAILITDGPLVDPPQPFRGEEYEKFINMRTNAIRELLENKVLPVGFVKRVIGNIFSSALKEELKKYTHELDSENVVSIADIGDYALGTFLFELKRRVLTERANLDFILYTKPREVPENEIKSYKDYKEKGISIYYSIIKLSGKKYPRRPIYRIEIPFLDQPSEKELIKRFEEALKLLYLWTPVGLKYPLPVSLAHQMCTIRKSVAKVLVKEILTRFISDNIKTSNMIDGELLKHYLLDRGF